MYILGKALGGGLYPVSAVAADRDVLGVITPGTHGSTFGGTPLACAAALAVLNVMERDNLLEKVRKNGAAWKVELEKLVAEFPSKLKAITGRGYMIGLVVDNDPAAYSAALREAGLLAPTAGTHTVRLLPPLIATPTDLARATGIIRSVLAAKK
jgi:acetylornithine aminotransferase/acetylornithine/N-succinyldiaminopimelate aminotransferase